MAIINPTDLTSVDADFENDTTADATEVNTVINAIIVDLNSINSGGMVTSAIVNEISDQISDNPISVDLTNSIPILYGIRFGTSPESTGRRITLLTANPTRYIVYQNKTFTVGEMSNSYFTDQVVYFEFGDDDLAGNITLQVAAINDLPALHATKRRFIFAVLSYMGSGTTSELEGDWHLSVVVQSELLHAGLLQAGTLDTDRLDANSITASKLDTDSLGATSIKITSGGIISSEDSGDTNRLFQESGEKGFFLGYNAGAGAAGESTTGYAFDLMDSNGNGLSYNTGRDAGTQFKLHGEVVNKGVMVDNSATKIHRHWDYTPGTTAKVKIFLQAGGAAALAIDDKIEHEGEGGTAIVVSTDTSDNTAIVDNVIGDFGMEGQSASHKINRLSPGEITADVARFLDGKQGADYGFSENEKAPWETSVDNGFNVGVRWGSTVSTLSFDWTPLATGDGEYARVTVNFVLRIDAGGDKWVAFKVTDALKSNKMIYASSNYKIITGSNADGAAQPLQLSFIVDLSEETPVPRQYELWGSVNTGASKSFIGNIYWQAEEFFK